MKVLVTGATGLVGTHLAKRLAAGKIVVHYLTTRKDELKNEPYFKGFFWDPKNEVIDENCLEGVEAIVHLAGASISKRWTREYKQEIIGSRVLSAHLLLKLLKEQPNTVKHFVSASAIGIYKDSLSLWHDEAFNEVEPSFIGSVVKKWECAADRFEQLDIKVAKIRTGLVLAKDGGMLQQIKKPAKLGLGTAFGNGKQWQSWIHIDDLVSIYVRAISEEWEGVFNAVAPNPVTNEQLSKAVSKRLGKPFFLPNLPEWLLKLALGEMASLLFLSQKVKPARTLNQGFEFRYLDLDSALENLLK